jgi:hypothetical protein
LKKKKKDEGGWIGKQGPTKKTRKKNSEDFTVNEVETDISKN